MKRINTSGRLAALRGGNVVHRLDLRSRSGRRKQRRGGARLQQGPTDGEGALREVAKALLDSGAFERAGGRDDAADSQARHRIQLLERRLRKMTALLEQQGKEISSAGALEDHGIASVFREVQGIGAGDALIEHKKTLMASIFRENLKLRERDASGPWPGR